MLNLVICKSWQLCALKSDCVLRCHWMKAHQIYFKYTKNCFHYFLWFFLSRSIWHQWGRLTRWDYRQGQLFSTIVDSHKLCELCNFHQIMTWVASGPGGFGLYNWDNNNLPCIWLNLRSAPDCPVIMTELHLKSGGEPGSVREGWVWLDTLCTIRCE